jgi:hypothetical protein
MRMIDVVTVLSLSVTDVVVRRSTYVVAMPSIIPKPIFCPNGIFKRMIVGMGITKRMMSDIMLTIAMMIYMAAWSIHFPVANR